MKYERVMRQVCLEFACKRVCICTWVLQWETGHRFVFPLANISVSVYVHLYAFGWACCWCKRLPHTLHIKHHVNDCNMQIHAGWGLLKELPKNKNLVIVYSPSYHYKPVWLIFFSGPQKETFSTVFKLHFYTQWKSMAIKSHPHNFYALLSHKKMNLILTIYGHMDYFYGVLMTFLELDL